MIVKGLKPIFFEVDQDIVDPMDDIPFAQVYLELANFE